MNLLDHLYYIQNGEASNHEAGNGDASYLKPGVLQICYKLI